MHVTAAEQAQPPTAPRLRPEIISVPFTARLNPYRDEATRHHGEWMTQMGLLSSADERSRLDRWGMGTLAGYCYPGAERKELDLLTDWCGFWVVFDDQFDNPDGARPDVAGAIMDMALAVACAEPGSNPYPDIPFCAALGDLMERVAAYGVSPTWMTHLRQTIREMLAGFHQQFLDHARGVQLDFEQLLRSRRRDIAMQHLYDLLALQHGWELPESVSATREFGQMHDALHEAMAMVNDAYSGYRDRGRLNQSYNTAVLLEGEGMSEEEALAELNRRTGRLLDRYLELKADVPMLLALMGLEDRAQGRVMRYLEDVETLFAGACYLHRVSDRYNPEAAYSSDDPTFVSRWGFPEHASLIRPPAASTPIVSG
ncbi:terpene synthase family protein [Streptomyces cremeus]|uniref:Terpene synthase n=1 Tax=Streptomyces cremeus TaxID=66881 RepID=A0ABV5P6Z1_STRCM